MKVVFTSSITINTEDQLGMAITVKHQCISVMIEDGFLKVIDTNGALHAYNTNSVTSYHLSVNNR